MPGLLTVIPEVIQGVNANSVMGNNTGSAGQCVEMTAAQTRALLGLDATDAPRFDGLAISDDAITVPTDAFSIFNHGITNDDTNNEQLKASWSGNVATIETLKNGTGTDRNLHLSRRAGLEAVTLANSQVNVLANGTSYRFTKNEGFYPTSKETLGDSGTNRQWSIGYIDEIVMNKTTLDDGFINFQATADADATSAISTLTTSGATTHHVQIEINGTKAWIAASTTDPS